MATNKSFRELTSAVDVFNKLTERDRALVTNSAASLLHLDSLALRETRRIAESLSSAKDYSWAAKMLDDFQTSLRVSSALAGFDLKKYSNSISATALTAHVAWKHSLGSAAAFEHERLMDMVRPNPLAIDITGISAMLDGMKAYDVTGLTRITDTNLTNRYSDIRESLSSIKQPWLDANRPLSSFAGFAEIQSIGHSIRNLDPFGSVVTNQLREDFGDWRNPIELDINKILGPVDRTDFYFDQGLNPALTAFSKSSFVEGTLRAGLRGHTATVEEGQVLEVIIDQDEEDAPSEERLEAALLYVSKFERHMRRFITQKMVEAFGDEWFMQSVPDEVRRYCVEKQQEARDRGQRAGELIEYADFTHYLKIITNRKNWKTIFVHYFQSQPRIEESLQRMYPFRNSAMHARAFTNEDELYLLTETSRILKAIGVETSLRGEVKLIIKP